TLPRTHISTTDQIHRPTAGAFGTQHANLDTSAFIYTWNDKVIEIRYKRDFKLYDTFDLRKYNYEQKCNPLKPKDEGYLREIVRVTDCIVGTKCLLICTRTTKSEYRFLLYNIYERIAHTLPMSLDKLIPTINDVVFSEKILHSDDENQKLNQARTTASASYLIVIASAIGISLYRLLPPEEGFCSKFRVIEEHYQQLYTREPVSAVNVYVSSHQLHGTNDIPFIIAGGMRGLIEIFSYEFDLKIQQIQSIEPPVSLAPITHIISRPPHADNKGLIIVGHGGLDPALNDDFIEQIDPKPIIRFFKTSFGFGDRSCQEFEQSFEGRPDLNVIKGRIVAITSTADGIDYTLCVALESIYLEKDANDGPELAIFKIEGAQTISLICWENISALCNSLPVLDIDAPIRYARCEILLPDRTVFFDPNIKTQYEVPYDLKPSFTEWFDKAEFIKFTPYASITFNGIRSRRNQMDGELIFDMLLQFVNIDPESYPPLDIEALKTLFDEILKSNDIDMLRKHCLVYYLLKDWQAFSKRHQKYAARYLIPPNFLCLMDGYWALDHWQFAEAIRFLTEPTVTVDWDIKVMQVLLKHVGPYDALKYTNLNSTQEKSPENIEIYMEILLQCDICEALLFQRQHRTHADDLALFKKLLDFCFLPKPDADRLNTLLNTVMDENECAFLKKYCESDDQETRKHFLIMYNIHHGNIIESIKENELLRRQSEGGGSGTVSTHMRNKYIGSIMETLPPMQLKEISMEVDKALSSDKRINNLSVTKFIELDEMMKQETQIIHSPILSFQPSVRDSTQLSPERQRTTPPSNIDTPVLTDHSPFTSPQNDRTPVKQEPSSGKRKSRSITTPTPTRTIITRSMAK
ncbi:6934_t:CDS:2, partial [Scutellospora calospora]